MTTPSNLHLAWARIFVRAATSAGVTEAVLSPGSRSTPLALALASAPGLRLHVVVDERSAAFFALGQARVTGRPSLLVCTSGTAGAHYLPAIIHSIDRQRYYETLRQPNTALRALVVEAEENSLDNALKFFRESRETPARNRAHR